MHYGMRYPGKLEKRDDPFRSEAERVIVEHESTSTKGCIGERSKEWKEGRKEGRWGEEVRGKMATKDAKGMS